MTDRLGWITRSIRVLAFASAISGAAASLASAENPGMIRIGGTGMALAAMRQAGRQLRVTDPAFQFEVLPSLGSPGGLAALRNHAIDIAVIGRPLAPGERAEGMTEARCLATPLLFVSSHPAPAPMAVSDLPGIYARPDPVWPDGTPLKILLRARAGSEIGYLTAAIPGMAEALEAAYRRPGVPITTTDQENADLALRTAGSFAIMTLLQLRAEQLTLRTVLLDGITPTADNVVSGAYPLSVRVCIVVPAVPIPGAAKFVTYLTSQPGLALMRSLGAVTSD